MKRAPEILVLLWVAVILVSCQQSPLAPPPPSAKNPVIVSVQSVYTYSDSTGRYFNDGPIAPSDGHAWEKGSGYKIAFTLDSAQWDSRDMNGVILFNVYRRYKGSSSTAVVGRVLSGNSGFSKGDRLIYQSALGSREILTFDSVNYVYNAINNYNLGEFQYGVSATVGLERSDTVFSGGFENGVAYSPFQGGGLPTRFLINDGNLATPTREVTVSGQIDISGLTAIIVSRYSEIFPLDSSIIIKTIANGVSGLRGGVDTFFLDAARTTAVKLNPDSTLLRKNRSGVFDLGRIGRIDTVRRSDFPSYFKTFIGNAQNPNMVEFTRKDTLVDGLGKKWITIQGIWDGSFTGNKWNFLSDDIAIAPYYPYLALDKSRQNTLVKSTGSDFQICVLDDDIFFEFNTFGDSTFSDTFQVWLVSRQYAANLMDATGSIKSASIQAFPQTGVTVSLDDCLLETPPQTFALNEFGVAKEKLSVDFKENYRISPLKDVMSHDQSKGGLNILSYTQDQLGCTVKPGSLLGFKEANLNRFISNPDSTNKDTVTFFAGSANQMTPFVQKVMGWHVVLDEDFALNLRSRFPDSTKVETMKTYVPERIYSYDNKAWFLSPFRGIPMHVAETRNGFKEFMLVVYARGKYFHEPRVFLSRANSQYKCVWDKIPPQIVWATNWDPAGSSWFAPLYTKTQVSNLLLLNNIFNVCLSNNTSGEWETSIRDVGFGKIVSATLCFHSSEEAYTSDPETGLRTYSTPVKRYALPQSEIDAQDLFTFGTAPKSNTKDHISYALINASFQNINARQWKSGIWDMWIETEDDLGNKGLAPFGGAEIAVGKGEYLVRQIEIK